MKEKSEIVAIPNKYKEIFKNLMEYSNVEFLAIFKSKNPLIDARSDLNIDYLGKYERCQKNEKGH